MQNTDVITFLGASSVAGSKHFAPGVKTSYACGAGPFSVLRVPVSSLEDAAQYLAACPPHAFAIFGRPVDPSATSIPWRSSRVRKDGRQPTIEAVSHYLIPIDVDKDGDKRNGLDIEANALAYRDTILPEGFRGAACLALATSSAGMASGTRMRLWFWLDRALSGAELTAWLHEYDVSIYRPSQPIYCAHPTFDGVADPFEGRPRHVLLPGGDVHVPAELPAAPVRTRREGGTTPAQGRNTFLTSLAGTMRRRGMSEGGILAALLVENDDFPEPLDEEEVEDIAQSVGSYEPESVQVAVAAKPVTEKVRQDAERVLKRVQERVKDDPQNWRAHVEALGPALATGALAPGVALSRIARTFGDAGTAVSVSADEIGAAIGTVASEGHTAIATVQEGWLVAHAPQMSKEGDALVPGAYNLGLVLRHAPELQGIRWDPRFEIVRVWLSPWERPCRDAGSPWSKADEHELKAWLCIKFGWTKPPGDLFDAVVAACRFREYDWWTDTLTSCERAWDGTPRLGDPAFVGQMLGCEATEAHAEFLRKWLISAVARAFAPGTKVDDVLVLYSKQGRFKGRVLSALLGVGDGALTRGADYLGELTEQSKDFNDKDVLGKLGGKVIIEIGENTALAARNQSAVKAFLSARSDEYRTPYERSNEKHKRTFVFVVTTNEEEIFSDLTGNRRYKVITCAHEADVELVRATATQLWGEAVARHRAGEPHHYSADEHADTAETHTTEDPWMDILRVGVDLRKAVTALTANEALALVGMPEAQRTQMHARRAGACLRALGWVPGNRRVGGKQMKAFWRPEETT